MDVNFHFDGWVDYLSDTAVIGWAINLSDPIRSVEVELIYNNTVILSASADVYRDDLRVAGIGNGNHGFRFEIGQELSRHIRAGGLQVRIKRTNHYLGSNAPAAIETHHPAPPSAASPISGQKPGSIGSPSIPQGIDLLGAIDRPVGTTLRGWAWNPHVSNHRVEAEIVCDGTAIATVVCELLRRDLKEKSIGDGHCGFEAKIPAHLLDDRTHAYELREKSTQKLIASRELAFPKSNSIDSIEDYFRQSAVSHVLEGPFDEREKSFFAYMEFYTKKLCLHNVKYRPLVTVIMPFFNRQTVLSLAIQSVLDQTYSNFELIVIDDGSSDNSVQIVRQFQDPRIKLIVLSKNCGVAAARNKGIEASSGEIITYLDSDNTWDCRYIQAFVAYFDLHPEARAAYCAQYVYRDIKNSPDIRFGFFNQSLLENRNFIDLNCYVHRRSLINDVGLFDERLKRYVDWDLIARYSVFAPPHALACLLSNYYLDKCANSITNSEWSSSTNQVLLSKRYALAFGFIDNNDQFHVLYKYLKNNDSLGEFISRNNLKLDRFLTRTQIAPTENIRRHISIIIPSYENLSGLKKCISSLLAQNSIFPLVEIIIVDNNSGYETRKYLDSISSPHVRIIFNDHNYGFTHSVNIGIEAADVGSDIIILNNDAVATPGSISALHEVAIRDTSVGLVIPRQVLLPGSSAASIHVPEADLRFEVDVSLSAHHNNIIGPVGNTYNSEIELSFAPFFCVYIPRQTLNDIGILDAEFGRHHRSDRVYCSAVRHIAMKKIIYTPKSKFYRLSSKSDNISDHKTIEKNQWEDHLMKIFDYRVAKWDN